MKTLQNADLYNQIRSQTGSYFEVRIVRDPDNEAIVYGMDKLKSITVHPALFENSGPQIGGVHSTPCHVKIVEESVNWPRAADFNVEVRATDGRNVSEWISMGRFHTDERHFDKYGNLELVAYDGMLKLEQSWTDKVEELPAEWPITCYEAAELLQEATGIEIVNANVIDNSVSCIGLDTTSTAREVYATIAAVMGGNWQMMADGRLKFIRLRNIDIGTASIAGLAIVDEAIVGNETLPEGGESNYIDIGTSVVNYDFTESLPAVSNVILETSSGTQASITLGQGYTLKGKCDFANSDAVAVSANRLYGYSYRPFNATGARLDPIAEVGDEIDIDGNRFTIITINWNIAPHITASLSAPFEETIDHEYSYISESAKTLRKAIGYTDGQIQSVSSFIEQTENAIRSGIESSYVDNDSFKQFMANYTPTIDIQNSYYSKSESDELIRGLKSFIELQDDALNIEFTKFFNSTSETVNTLTYYIQYSNGVITIGSTDSLASITISNTDGIQLWYNGEVVSYWNSNEQFTPKALRIPKGGKFTLGSILFQPRTSGNMSLLWVGDS